MAESGGTIDTVATANAFLVPMNQNCEKNGYASAGLENNICLRHQFLGSKKKSSISSKNMLLGGLFFNALHICLIIEGPGSHVLGLNSKLVQRHDHSARLCKISAPLFCRSPIALLPHRSTLPPGNLP
jgi:hypothetical protein